MKELVSAKWLNKNLSDPNLIVLDASVTSSSSGEVFKTFKCIIPKARRFDLKNVFLNLSSCFPNTVPKPEIFEVACRKLGIHKESKIIVYDDHGIFSSPRVWWLFKIMGHQKIAVLNGGLPKWISEGFQTEKQHSLNHLNGTFKALYQKNLVVTFGQIKKNTLKKEFLIVDARSEGRFNGIESEPRKYLKSGHIKHSVNIPYQEVLIGGKYKSKKRLKELFENKCAGEKELVFSCGSGLTACIVMLACVIGYVETLKVYDGSWTEWADLNNLKNIEP
ncbi:sulfurtransferase [Zhouia sp. PK063]|uniref:sulfurtransferase n=1 Tax=Zhouia sp. PK063 TaxID=3373602 RepID=UPI0037956B64